MITDRLYRLLQPVPGLHAYYGRFVRKLPHRERTVNHFDQTLLVDPSELSGYHLYYEREYDGDVFRFLQKKLNRSLWALDVGANIGIYTTFLARHCRTVDAFEPDSALVKRLKRNLALNGLNNVVIHTYCISDKTGHVSFERPPDANWGLGRIRPDGVLLPAMSLDDFLSNTTDHQPLFIKMDIEGAEWLAMQGAQSVLCNWTQPLAVLIEVHPEQIGDYGGSLEALHSMLESKGLTVSSLSRENLTGATQPPRFWWVTNPMWADR